MTDMSGTTRAMFWDGTWGAVLIDGHFNPLKGPPLIDGLDLEQIDYAPLKDKRMVLERGQEKRWRPMTDAECARVERKMQRGVVAFNAIWRRP